mgnify:CR=1 FL=1
MIVNRNDYHVGKNNQGYGVGYQLLNKSSFDQSEIDLVLMLLARCKEDHGAGVVALDCGANIGVHTIEWARMMYRWGRVISFEAQEKIYYALAGNIALNNCLNATAHLCALGASCGKIEIPIPDYFSPSSYGSLELRERPNNEFIGQKIDYKNTQSVHMVTIDSLSLPRVDLIKIDVEGMEEEVLAGAKDTICHHHPILLIEIIKSNRNAIQKFLSENDYTYAQIGINLLAIHQNDSVRKFINFEEKQITIKT